MPLQLPAESKWHAHGSTCHTALLQGLFHGLNAKRVILDKEICAILKLADLVGGHHPQSVPSGLLHLTGLQELFPRSLTSYSWAKLPLDQILPT